MTKLVKNKLDGVGPVDNRPSTDKLHHFVKKQESKLPTDATYNIKLIFKYIV